MKKRVVSFLLAMFMFGSAPAETVFAMPSYQADSTGLLNVAESTSVEISEVTENEEDETKELSEQTTDETEEVTEGQQEETEAPIPTEVPSGTAVPENIPDRTEDASDTESEEETSAETAEPAEDETETPTEAPSELPTVTPTEEVTKEEDEEPLETPSELPTETPMEESAEEATASPVETPSETPSETPVQQTKINEKVFMDEAGIKAVGSNGVKYEGVAYLSAATVNNLSDESIDVYTQMCDEIASWEASGKEYQDIVISVDAEGNLCLGVSVPLEPSLAEETIAENELLASEYDIPEETVETDAEDSLSMASFDTLMENTDNFRRQLVKSEQAIYDVAKTNLINKNKTGFTYKESSTGKENYLALAQFQNAISALVNTYPNKLSWMDYGSSKIRYNKYWYKSGYYKYVVTVKKSKFYKASLETSAKKKVNKIVKEAKAYADANDRENYVYAMVEYFDKWICENNTYDSSALDSSYEATAKYYYSHSCYGTLLKGYGICQSYAMTMSRLLDAAGIRNMYVTGTANGAGHAWNYVQMPDGHWYLLDSAWNDNGSSSSKRYFLMPNDGVHIPKGDICGTGNLFFYATLESTAYTPVYENAYLDSIKMNETSIYIKTGSKYQLKVEHADESNYYLDNYAKTWSSSNTKVAKVDKNGKVTAGSSAGNAVITCVVAGHSVSCEVNVYQITGLTFDKNSKTSYKETYVNEDGVFNTNDRFKVKLTVSQKQPAQTTAEKLWSCETVTCYSKSGNPSVASIYVTAVDKDSVILMMQPNGVGTTKVTVKFGGKTATYQLTVKQKLQDSWFNLDTTSYAYNGKVRKPKVVKAASAPDKVKYTVSYQNNKMQGQLR